MTIIKFIRESAPMCIKILNAFRNLCSNTKTTQIVVQVSYVTECGWNCLEY